MWNNRNSDALPLEMQNGILSILAKLAFSEEVNPIFIIQLANPIARNIPQKTQKFMFTQILCECLLTISFIIAKNWKLLSCEWLNNLWYIQTMEYYWVIKK